MHLSILLTSLACCGGFLAISPARQDVWAAVGRARDAEEGDVFVLDKADIRASILRVFLPLFVCLSLSSFIVGVVAILLLDSCWHGVISHDFLAVGCNVIASIWILAQIRAENTSALSPWRLSLSLFGPWIIFTFLQLPRFSCSDDFNVEAYFATRLVYFCYRTVLAIPLLSSRQCLLCELMITVIVACFYFGPELHRFAMVSIMFSFLLLVCYGVTMAGDSLVTWSFRNEATAKNALSAVTSARRDLLQKLCDTELYLTTGLKMKEPSLVLAGMLGRRVADLDGKSFNDVLHPSDRPRFESFLENVTGPGANRCIQVRMKGIANSLDVRIYHASQLINETDHCLAIIVLLTEEAHGSGASSHEHSGGDFGTEAEESDRRGSVDFRLPRAVREEDERSNYTDSLVCSESIISRSMAASQRGRPKSFQARGIQTTPTAEASSALMVDGSTQTREPKMMQKPPKPPPLPKKTRPFVFVGDTVPHRRRASSDTCRLLLLDMAKKLNVNGRACCPFHMVVAYLQKQIKMIVKGSCRSFDFNNAWQCGFCGVLHAEEDEEFWCDACGSSGQPASQAAESSRDETSRYETDASSTPRAVLSDAPAPSDES